MYVVCVDALNMTQFKLSTEPFYMLMFTFPVLGNLYAVSGPSELDSKAQPQGITISMDDGKVLGTWKPKTVC